MARARRVVVQSRSIHVWMALICAAAVVFPILASFDELNTGDAIVMPTMLAAVALLSIALLRSGPAIASLVHIATPSDPRSPPAR